MLSKCYIAHTHTSEWESDFQCISTISGIVE